ncbi:MAG: dTDP-4-amino-4,6-dideoxygalactose transaminase [Glaciecola sp.]|jgi:dTDP-4-amino-4,6-dideoxygalactose transaminase
MDSVKSKKLFSADEFIGNCKKDSVQYVENKFVDYAVIQNLLAVSSEANQWTNFGPISKLLEAQLTKDLNLEENLRVVACCNATVALHSLVALHETLAKRPLRWVTCAFGFYSSADGILCNANIVDCNTDGMLDLTKLDLTSFDGLIVTNLFGYTEQLEKYTTYAEAHNKILIVDSAMAYHQGGHNSNECISLHHTKPWGFGEGGCAIVHKDDEAMFRDLISFGHNRPDAPIHRIAVNGKISDVACAFILMRLQQMQSLRTVYQEQYQRIAKIGINCGLSILANSYQHPGIPASVPFLLPDSLEDIACGDFPLKRYYHPLSKTKQAYDIYNRIINIPCHPEMVCYSDEDIANVLGTLIARI